MYRVAILKNDGLEMRMSREFPGKWDDTTEFWWTDGNMGCDCNLAWEFHRAIHGEDADDLPEVPCGITQYTVLYALYEGKTFPIESG